MLISLPDGLHFEAVAPGGDEVKAGGSYIGEFLNPGDSLIMKARMKVDKPGLWKIWPAYNAQNNKGIVQYNPEEWGAAEIFIDEKYIPMPDLTIIEAGVAGTGENGLEKKFYYVVENTGPLGASASVSKILINNEEPGVENPVGMIPSGESQKAFFTLGNISKGDKITIILDGPNAIGELEEDNNEWSFAVNLQNDVAKTSGTGSGAEISEGPGKEVVESGNVVYCPATTAVCCDVTVQFIVLGVLSVLMSVFSFALGYYYCQTKKCENEIGWMYSKLKRMDIEKITDKSIPAEEVPISEEISEVEEVLKGKSEEKPGKEEDQIVKAEPEEKSDDKKNSDEPVVEEQAESSGEKKQEGPKNAEGGSPGDIKE
ncbi:MAG: hypothetical protein JW931_01490 [Methanomicrobiaceae archaeon]|nr:hypothetical protein [Methanomicrobiaceae archaeon]